MKTRLLIIIGIVLILCTIGSFLLYEDVAKQFEVIDDFDTTFGGPGDRHPAYFGYEIPRICTEGMIKHLVKHSNMFFADEENFSLEWAGLPDSVNEDDFDICFDELLELREMNSRSLISDNEIQTALEYCSGKFGIIPESKTLWINETHKIISETCELEKRFNSGVSIDRTVYPIPESYSEINPNCMTLEQSKKIVPFFKVPSYLPEGYSMKCSRSSTPTESYILYHNKDISDGWVGKIPMLIEDGAIFIYQYDEKNRKGFETYDSPEQRIQSTYDDVIEKNPSLQPQLIRINGMLAFAVDSCPDCGMQTANFTDGTSIQKSTSTETKIKFKDEYGVSYMLKTTLSLDELILVAESLQ